MSEQCGAHALGILVDEYHLADNFLKIVKRD